MSFQKRQNPCFFSFKRGAQNSQFPSSLFFLLDPLNYQQTEKIISHKNRKWEEGRADENNAQRNLVSGRQRESDGKLAGHLQEGSWWSWVSSAQRPHRLENGGQRVQWRMAPRVRDWWHISVWSGWTLSSLFSPVSSGYFISPSDQELKGQHWSSEYQDKWREQESGGKAKVWTLTRGTYCQGCL